MKIVNIYKAGTIEPKSVVILLHGYGANGQDLIGLATEWQADLPDTLFLSPDAPELCEINPSGRQWFSLENKSYATMESGAALAMSGLNDFIESTIKNYNVPASKLALVGFSQGTMMSLYIAPRQKVPLAGVLGYSGLLLGAQELSTSAVARCPVCLVHGDDDMVVDSAAFEHDFKVLQDSGFPVSGQKIQGLGHGINEQGLEIGRNFLRKTLT